MLPSVSARNRFNKLQHTCRLVVYDADSSGTQSGHLPEGNNILALLRKFANDSDSAYKCQLLWLKSGLQGMWKERRDLVDTRPVDPDADDDETSTSVCPNNLPMSAFGSSSTLFSYSFGFFCLSNSLPFTSHTSGSTFAFNVSAIMGSRMLFNLHKSVDEGILSSQRLIDIDHYLTMSWSESCDLEPETVSSLRGRARNGRASRSVVLDSSITDLDVTVV
ncbi:hypothetical protein D9758_015007 [Tetrapyrgos nigripes]|uniref:Uncharacterized protein n=1 Tax=Tetrapyrgos nigripes TaxID=182062 RepID=A0A8H5CF40_9AGAR|nr:hypothetical protein D9758_015007 [Tetrapyrgos nigripes]